MRELDLEMTETRGIEFGQIPSHSKVTFSIPFTSDVDLSSLNVLPTNFNLTKQLAIELKYTTSSGTYSYSHSCIIASGLPLSVGVTDAFRPKRSQSRWAQ